MKAEERKEIETNSLVLTVQKLKQRVTGRTLYYVIGVLVLVVAGILIYRYMTSTARKGRDAILLQLNSADTPEKLKQGMEDHRGTLYGSLFKLNLARHELLNEGLPKLGTDRAEERKQAVASIDKARVLFLELTGELKQKDEPALVQDAWLGAARAEEALVSFPTTDGGTDSRGNPDKVIEYYEKAASIFPDSAPSKRSKAWAEKIKANKVQFVATQKEIYKPIERPSLPPIKGDPFTSFPGVPKLEFPPPGEPKIEVPQLPKTPDVPGVPMPDPKKAPDIKAPDIKLPEIPAVPTPDPKKAPDIKAPDPKPTDPPKTGDPKDPKAK